MKGFVFLFMLFFVAVAYMYLAYSSNGIGSTTTLKQGMVSIDERSSMSLAIERRKLKGNTKTHSKNEDDRVGLEDYRPIDPVPSSTSSIRPGPVQHGTPFLPYIPEPSPPPTEPKHDEFP